MTVGQFLAATIAEFFEYKTPKIVQIKNKKLGAINRLIQLAIILYVIIFSIVKSKGYQKFSGIDSAVTTKIKGVVSTANLADAEFSNKTPPENYQLYKRIWDTPDYVIPPSETNAFFVMTNVVITANQTQSTCPEDPEVAGALCSSDSDCEADRFLYLGNGPETGKCHRPEGQSSGTCEIKSWCPLEMDSLPLTGNRPLLAATKNFTVLIKNTVTFSDFNVERRNILETDNATFLKICKYGKETTDTESPLCPIFELGQIVAEAGQDYDELASKGAVIGIIISWNCDLDLEESKCLPKYSFRRLDDAGKNTIAPGWNFRFANVFSRDERTLFKAYGIRFSIIVNGSGGKFNIVPLLNAVGSGVGLLAITTVICDVIAFYFSSAKNYYRSSKFQLVDDNDEAQETEVVAHVQPSRNTMATNGSYANQQTAPNETSHLVNKEEEKSSCI
ncbi:P2X purinoceptor 4 [Halotydeus destructor]|nr:P2X purinoceptor 4 [Halotydeus destructor]